MKFIWYNPDLDEYEKGNYETFSSLVESSNNGGRYDILYEFPEGSDLLIDKILNSLNLVRQQSEVA